MIIKRPSKPCGKHKILKQNHKEIDLSLPWCHPLFLDRSSKQKNSLKREILRWRAAITGGDNKIPLVTVLSHNELEDKLSLVLVPLIASAGMRVLKFIWRDDLSGKALLNTLLSLPGVSLPSNPEDIQRTLERTGGVYATLPESSPFLDTDPPWTGLDAVARFKALCLFTIYAVRWEGITLDIRVGDYPHQTKIQKARHLAMDLKEHCEAAGPGFSIYINDQNQPLGHALGPVLEFREAVDVLNAKGPLDLTKIALELGADLIMFADKFSHRTEAKSYLKNQLLSGAAHARFKEIIQAIKCTAEVEEDLFSAPLTRRQFDIVSPGKGYVQRIAMDRLLDLKQRLCREEQGAGLLLLKHIGDTADKNEKLAKVYLPSSWSEEFTLNEVQSIFTISSFPPEFQPQTQEKIKGSFRF